MGYKRASKKFNLQFTGELEGLEVQVKSITMGEMLELEGIFTGDDKTPSSEDIQAVFQTFVKALISWNLEDEKGKPVPATLKGLYSQDIEFIMEIIASWMEAMTNVDRDLGKGSTSGVNSAEASIPMEML